MRHIGEKKGEDKSRTKWYMRGYDVWVVVNVYW